METDKFDLNGAFSIAFFCAFVLFTIFKSGSTNSSLLTVISILLFSMTIVKMGIDSIALFNDWYKDRDECILNEYPNEMLTPNLSASSLTEQVFHVGYRKTIRLAKDIKSDKPRLMKDVIETVFTNASIVRLTVVQKVLYFLYYFFVSLIIAALFFQDEVSTWVSGISIYNLTLWSFVLILFQTLIKNRLLYNLNRLYYYCIKRKARRFINKYNGGYNDALFNIDRYD